MSIAPGGADSSVGDASWQDGAINAAAGTEHFDEAIPMISDTTMTVPTTKMMGASNNNNNVKHKRRYCRIPGCTKIVKSQGLCQGHGAKPRQCKVSGCPKQAQGNFDGMCKSHFKAHKRKTTPLPQKEATSTPPPPQGESVYDRVLPESVAWNQNKNGKLMPLIQHLKDGFDAQKPPAWHRNEERRARGLFPVHNAATQLEGWERELVWMEILVLTGNADSSFRHLARGWGRDKGFHMVLSQFICERRGNVERKKREKLMQSAGGAVPSSTIQLEQEEPAITADAAVGADAWDDACYGDAAYNEALAADLFFACTSAADDDEE